MENSPVSSVSLAKTYFVKKQWNRNPNDLCFTTLITCYIILPENIFWNVSLCLDILIGLAHYHLKNVVAIWNHLHLVNFPSFSFLGGIYWGFCGVVLFFVCLFDFGFACLFVFACRTCLTNFLTHINSYMSQHSHSVHVPMNETAQI